MPLKTDRIKNAARTPFCWFNDVTVRSAAVIIPTILAPPCHSRLVCFYTNKLRPFNHKKCDPLRNWSFFLSALIQNILYSDRRTWFFDKVVRCRRLEKWNFFRVLVAGWSSSFPHKEDVYDSDRSCPAYAKWVAISAVLHLKKEIPRPCWWTDLGLAGSTRINSSRAVWGWFQQQKSRASNCVDRTNWL
jgi:hypothetical protein